MSNLEQIVNEISEVIFFNGFSKSEKVKVERIILSESDKMSKANDICEKLGIEKRENRASILRVLNKYF